MKAQPYSFQATIQKDVALDYFLYLPAGYEGSDKEWPLILFLHGMGERGDDLELLKLYGIPKNIEGGMTFPFIIAAPQCPMDTIWSHELDALRALLDLLIGKYRVDTSRIYLTGLSMGGSGSWHFATEYPSLFAAVVPICGWAEPYTGFPDKVKAIKDVPIWVFHGAKDDVIPLSSSQELVEVLEAHQGNVKFTIYPDLDHDSWSEAYANPELYQWLLKQQNQVLPKR